MSDCMCKCNKELESRSEWCGRDQLLSIDHCQYMNQRCECVQCDIGYSPETARSHAPLPPKRSSSTPSSFSSPGGSSSPTCITGTVPTTVISRAWRM